MLFFAVQTSFHQLCRRHHICLRQPFLLKGALVALAVLHLSMVYASRTLGLFLVTVLLSLCIFRWLLQQHCASLQLSASSGDCSSGAHLSKNFYNNYRGMVQASRAFPARFQWLQLFGSFQTYFLMISNLYICKTIKIKLVPPFWV